MCRNFHIKWYAGQSESDKGLWQRFVRFFPLFRFFLELEDTNLPGRTSWQEAGQMLEGVEGQMKGITAETTELLNKTNRLADDIQEKSLKLNTVVDAVQEVGTSVRQFNNSIQQVSQSVTSAAEQNREKISQVVSWSNAALEIWNRWKQKKMREE